MKTLYIGTCFLILLLFFCQSTGMAQSEFVITEGIAAVIGGNTVVARDKAIDDALRKAVEQAVGTLVSSDTMTEKYKVIHDKVLAQTTGYIRKYKILSEKAEGKIYRIKIQAEVGRANLMNDLRALGLLHVLAEKPKVMVIMEEKVAGLFGTSAWEKIGQAESTLMEKFLAAGFNVVDSQTVKANITRDQALRMLEGDSRAVAAAGLQFGAQVVMIGKALSKNAGGKVMDTQLQSLQAVVQARAVRSDDARVIASRSEQDSKAHIDEARGGVLAIKGASERLADALIKDILAKWRSETYGRTRQIAVVITGLVSYRHLTAVKKFLEREMQGVKAVHQRSYLSGSAELMLDYGGKSSNIADELANRKFTGFRLEPVNVTPHRLDVKVVLDK